MKKSWMVRLAVLILTGVTLSGCIWAIADDGHRRGDYNERGRGDRGQHRGQH